MLRCRKCRSVCSCSRALQAPREAGSTLLCGSMLPIRAGACVCVLVFVLCVCVCVCVCVCHQGGGMGFSDRTSSSMLVFVRGSRIPGWDGRGGDGGEELWQGNARSLVLYLSRQKRSQQVQNNATTCRVCSL